MFCCWCKVGLVVPGAGRVCGRGAALPRTGVGSRRGVGSPMQAAWAAPVLSPAAATSQRFCTTCPCCLCPWSRVHGFSVLAEPGLMCSLVLQALLGSCCSLEGKHERVQGGKWLLVSETDSQQGCCSARSKACSLLELLLHRFLRLMLGLCEYSSQSFFELHSQ